MARITKKKGVDKWVPYFIDSVEFTLTDSAMLRVCNHVATLGGTLASFCQEAAYNYATIYDWLKRDSGRWAKYQEALEARKAAMADVVLANLLDAALVDPRNLMANVRTPHKLTKAEAKSITNYKGETDKTPAEIKFTPVAQATETLGKHLGMFVAKTEVSGKDGGPVEFNGNVTNEAARRVAFLLSSIGCDGDGL